MAKIEVEGTFSRRIGNYVIYELNGQMIIRSISGFSSTDLYHNKKYEKCRQNAHEFGKLSSQCKAIRMALKGILPKSNNLAIVNAFTKKMRSLLLFDTISEKGKRQLAQALQNPSAKTALQYYPFNPMSPLGLEEVTLNDTSLSFTTPALFFPVHSNSIGVTTHFLFFDFITNESWLYSSSIAYFQKATLPEIVTVSLPDQSQAGSGTLFTLLEIAFFEHTNDTFMPLEEDASKIVVVLEVE
ncbi:hypothetical protein [Flavobacterium sp. NRK F7]|uniref:hypothetical protein n=1 Tax=Flavobacterium sp. NRK F7 TaxID=2954930 RepID=UPI0020915BA6|nr:hypothetical protein [Flavobacterium sp. NRK F7]MCO6163319.1 hypothetical protein [Flavobacterium sp. NRK F7]